MRRRAKSLLLLLAAWAPGLGAIKVTFFNLRPDNTVVCFGYGATAGAASSQASMTPQPLGYKGQATVELPPSSYANGAALFVQLFLASDQDVSALSCAAATLTPRADPLASVTVYDSNVNAVGRGGLGGLFSAGHAPAPESTGVLVVVNQAISYPTFGSSTCEVTALPASGSASEDTAVLEFGGYATGLGGSILGWGCESLAAALELKCYALDAGTVAGQGLTLRRSQQCAGHATHVYVVGLKGSDGGEPLPEPTSLPGVAVVFLVTTSYRGTPHLGIWASLPRRPRRSRSNERAGVSGQGTSGGGCKTFASNLPSLFIFFAVRLFDRASREVAPRALGAPAGVPLPFGASGGLVRARPFPDLGAHPASPGRADPGAEGEPAEGPGGPARRPVHRRRPLLRRLLLGLLPQPLRRAPGRDRPHGPVGRHAAVAGAGPDRAAAAGARLAGPG